MTDVSPDGKPRRGRPVGSKNKPAPTPPIRGKSRSFQYRTQFTWAQAAVGASSTIAAAWLQKPESPNGPAILLGLFYFRKPKEGRQKAQVWRVSRTTTNIQIKFLGSSKGHKEAYRTFYQPLRLAVRKAQKDAKAKALASSADRAHRAADMAARIVVGTPAKNDKRDLAVATRA
jgi:hypothetical protein